MKKIKDDLGDRGKKHPFKNDYNIIKKKDQKLVTVFTVFLKYYLDDNSESSIITLTDGILHSAVI